MSKTFTVAGWSVLKGVKKFRVANKLAERINILEKNGHTDIDLRALPHAMTKEDAKIFLEQGIVPNVPLAAVLAAAEDAVAAVLADTAVAEEAAEEETVDTAPITYATFEEALAAVPLRAKGRFIKKEVREQMAREMVAVAE